MSSEKRLFLTLILTIGSVYGIQYGMEKLGWIKPPAPPVVAQQDAAKENAKAKGKIGDGPLVARAKGDLPDDVFTPDAKVAEKETIKAKDTPPAKTGPRIADPAELVLGSDEDDSANAYHLKVRFDQKGAAVARATSAKFDAEYDPAAKVVKGRKPRLELIASDPSSDAPGSLTLTLASDAKADRPINAQPDDTAVELPKVEAPLDQIVWEVVRDKEDVPAVRAVTRLDQATKAVIEGQEIAFRTTSEDPAVTVTKVYRIWKGQDGFDVLLKFSSPKKDAKFTYRLFGTHGIPIEGEWYTSTFRDVFFGLDKNGTTSITKPIASTDIVKYKADLSTYHYSELPLKFAGVEDQYFTTFVQPFPIPRTREERTEREAAPVLFVEDLKAPQKSDVGIEVMSKPILVGPNLGEVEHSFRVYAGPKLATSLLPYEAEELASYRKQWIPIPYAAELAKYVIAPLLDKIYGLTQSIASVFGWKNGNYGIAIILLTMTVRLIMFPLGRKQAMMAKKMQDLQPVLAEVKEKYKDDKEALTRETMAVWKRHKVNPAAGCLPALIQMPIFVGLWQSLNNSVALRHSSFLWIRDLAAPDMAAKFPITLPLLGDYLNVLPFLVVSLMLVQTKLFAPPPTTPEAEMNQKMMKYMMIFMAFMFYKVPSGLGLYFITSSLWQICERLLLPKVIANHAKPASEDDLPGDKGRGHGGPGPNGNGPNNGNGNGGAQGWLGKKLEKLLEEAAKDKTIRNADINIGGREKERERERERERTRPRPRPGKRR